MQSWARSVREHRGALPHSQSHLIDPFVKRGTCRILVQLVLEADLILPRGRVDRPGLVESVTNTVKDQCVVTIPRRADELFIPLNVVPARCPVRTRNSVEDPSITLAIPRGPVAVSKVALRADHEFFA